MLIVFQVVGVMILHAETIVLLVSKIGITSVNLLLSLNEHEGGDILLWTCIINVCFCLNESLYCQMLIIVFIIIINCNIYMKIQLCKTIHSIMAS